MKQNYSTILTILLLTLLPFSAALAQDSPSSDKLVDKKWVIQTFIQKSQFKTDTLFRSNDCQQYVQFSKDGNYTTTIGKKEEAMTWKLEGKSVSILKKSGGVYKKRDIEKLTDEVLVLSYIQKADQSLVTEVYGLCKEGADTTAFDTRDVLEIGLEHRLALGFQQGGYSFINAGYSLVKTSGEFNQSLFGLNMHYNPFQQRLGFSAYAIASKKIVSLGFEVNYYMLGSEGYTGIRPIIGLNGLIFDNKWLNRCLLYYSPQLYVDKDADTVILSESGFNKHSITFRFDIPFASKSLKKKVINQDYLEKHLGN